MTLRTRLSRLEAGRRPSQGTLRADAIAALEELEAALRAASEDADAYRGIQLQIEGIVGNERNDNG